MKRGGENVKNRGSIGVVEVARAENEKQGSGIGMLNGTSMLGGKGFGKFFLCTVLWHGHSREHIQAVLIFCYVFLIDFL